ncbi:MAG: hypothetical protein A3K09_06965 [Nitrospinae bacterium RIFCSPLOWO2_12_FULL_47_7]|nr:MAG: hypothetical protein A3K09_06965 [Nitrospinae bacterium RIFCSPLOWO2_12_FULL_47_7]
MTLRKRCFLSVYTVCFLTSLVLLPFSSIAGAEQNVSYAVKGKSGAAKGDFVRARERAVAQAMKQAVEKHLRDVLGEDVYGLHEGALKKVILESERYVRSYRYFYVDDNVKAETSEVELEVALFTDALRRRLGSMGVINLPAPAGIRTIVVLINEKNLSTDSAVPFWDRKPVSERFLVKNFVAAGIKVVSRDSVRDKIGEETVLRAAKGDVGAAIDIGLKAGADIVVVGNVMSSLLDEGADKPVQVSMSLKVISSLNARVVAAKSDFIAIKKPVQAEAEMEAFDKVSKKLGDFFLASIQRFWSPGTGAQSEPLPVPATARGMDDL